jgi:polyhydroxyalkanoate synthesis repressor PhaR
MRRAGPVKSDAVIIKKYGNRRLYDTATSRYINLEEIAALIRKGKQVRVVDAKTGQDLTRVTLTQIIVEDAKDGPTGLPLELLRQLIVASDHVGREFVMWYLNSAFNAYHKVQESLQSGLSEVGSVALSPLQMMKGAIPGGGADDNALRKRLAELETRPNKPARQRKRRKATR